MTTLLGACALGLAGAASAEAASVISADTTRSLLRDPAVSGRATTLVAGGLDRTLLRFKVKGISGAPAKAVLRLRVTDPSIESVAARALPPAFGEDDGTPSLLLPTLAVTARVAAPKAGTWAEWDVTKAVAGAGDVGFQLSGPRIDPASFSSREGSDAPQLVVTPDDPAGVALAGLLDIRTAPTFAAGVHDSAGNTMDGLDVVAAPAGQGVPGRYIGVYHSFIGGAFYTSLATSDDLTTWTYRVTLDSHASMPNLVTLPDGGFVLALERDMPHIQYVSASNLVVRHYASWAALAGGAFDRHVDLPRTLAPTAEGTPALDVKAWAGPDASQIAITFHYFKNIDVDRQAAGTLTNFSAAGWAPQPDVAFNDTFIGLRTRGNLGDRADVVYAGHRFAIVEAQAIKSDFGTWRWFLYDRDRDEARTLGLRGPAGSFAIGNPTVRPLPAPTGTGQVLLISGYVFGQGAAYGEAGQFIALRPLA